ncbi:MAG TPA: hypothetical protein PK108_15165 [Pyrinomonadaceae bacterium]|nr:hypothetical protein [Acidobacteriota bacterium]HQZ94985.1 hypothetical protein [Pyrinomonadaceae bacterium]HRA41878.1 hypothetical protein [Pyrinomonadaceae bacterium]
MKNIFLLTVIAASLFVSACNVVGEPVEYANACDLSNNDKNIEVSGILEEKGGSIFCSNTSGRMECGYSLLAKAGDKEGISVDLEVGGGANTADKPASGFKREDLKIRDNAGQPVKLGDKVKLTGKLTSAKHPSSTVCYLKVYKIER